MAYSGVFVKRFVRVHLEGSRSATQARQITSAYECLTPHPTYLYVRTRLEGGSYN